MEEAQRLNKVGNYDWDLNTNKISWSDGIYDLFGMDRKSYNTTVAGFAEFIHPDDLDMISQESVKHLSNMEYHESNYRIIDQKTKKTKRVHVWGKTTFDSLNSPISIHGIMKDISESD